MFKNALSISIDVLKVRTGEIYSLIPTEAFFEEQKVCLNGIS